MEIFYRCDIDLEDDGLDFTDLLEKVLVLIRCRIRLGDIIQDQATDPMNGYIEPQERVLRTSTAAREQSTMIIKSFSFNSYTNSAHASLNYRFHYNHRIQPYGKV